MYDRDYQKQVFHLEQENKILMDKLEAYKNLMKLYPNEILIDELIKRLMTLRGNGKP